MNMYDNYERVRVTTKNEEVQLIPGKLSLKVLLNLYYGKTLLV